MRTIKPALTPLFLLLLAAAFLAPGCATAIAQQQAPPTPAPVPDDDDTDDGDDTDEAGDDDDASPVEPAAPLLRAGKGWEVYSWIDEGSGEWRFRVMYGTNRLKSVDSIVDPPEPEEGDDESLLGRVLVSVDELIECLSQLAENEFVFWPGPAAWAGDEDEPFEIPPAEVTERVVEFANDHGLDFTLADDDDGTEDGNDDGPGEQTAPLLHSMKGWEVYSWLDEESGEWRFRVVAGTNAIKSVDGIVDPEPEEGDDSLLSRVLLSVDELIECLSQFAEGEYVFWPGPAAWAGVEDEPFETPPDDMTEKVIEFAKDHGLELTVRVDEDDD